ncbi:SUMF1/EgtB/PvdO family nonheme iron enzyme [Sphingobacterium sp. WM]|nr:SUMF1/EgtB/PvdO family nonheme iron enzyme [Sphingobacterium sp. WM]WFB63479.1 SUMF1/EgtB/PvdO family nonheme iron enzyme [Sphingobacterium sp. WM]
MMPMSETKFETIINNLLVEIPKGKIGLRDDRKKEKWTVNIDAFLLSKYAVTQDLYFQITGQTPSTHHGGQRPVETVSWKEAVIFCNSLSIKLKLTPCYVLCQNQEDVDFDPAANGYRLPTEAEWEYACKAGTSAIRYGELDSIAWYKNNSGDTTHRVGKKEPNAWGLFDMLGNVWEWCSDLYDTEVYGSYRIFRGGGWCDEERSVMATTRRRSHPSSFKIDDLGFRIARSKTKSIRDKLK